MVVACLATRASVADPRLIAHLGSDVAKLSANVTRQRRLGGTFSSARCSLTGFGRHHEEGEADHDPAHTQNEEPEGPPLLGGRGAEAGDPEYAEQNRVTNDPEDGPQPKVHAGFSVLHRR
jgi:hypothetical protein